LDLTRAQTRRALNIAASTPAGTKRNFGTMTKPLHAGLASRSGVTAAVLAADGFTADETAISGDRGFWDLYGPESRSEFDLPDGWSLADDGVHVKAYPCCYFTHTSIAAAQALAEEHDLAPDDVRRIEVHAARGARDALRHSDPETSLEAKFSMEYAVASAVVFDEVGLATFEEAAIRDSAVRDLRNRVDFVVDDSLPYDSHEAVVRIVTNDASFERRREHPPWVHSHPPTESALRAKFEECAGRVLSSERVDGVYDTLAQLEAVADVEGALLRGAD
jgi:2-methylcitrate dehydratase PrpD